MKKVFYILIIFLLFKTNGNCQTEFGDIDKVAKSISFNQSESLAIKLTENYSTDKEKVRALFVWIANNIKYDTDLAKDQNLINEVYTSFSDVNNYTLKTKKAICSGYSYLFQSMCDEIGIESMVIDGFSRQIFDGFKVKEQIDHAWNAVKIDNKWYFVDTTWASGNVLGDRFEKEFNDFWFFTDPEEFIYSHYPLNPEWTLLDREFTKEDFYNLPTLNGDSFFNSRTKIIKPKDGIIWVNEKDEFKIVVKSEDENSNPYFTGSPTQTFATLNNLPEPTDEDYLKFPDKYSLAIPSFEELKREKQGDITTYTFKVKHKSLRRIWISLDYVQTAEYKVKWK